MRRFIMLSQCTAYTLFTQNLLPATACWFESGLGHHFISVGCGAASAAFFFL